MQDKSAQYSKAIDLVKSTIIALQKLRTDEYFSQTLLCVEKECKKFCIAINDAHDNDMDENETVDFNPCSLKRAKRATQISKLLHDSIVL